MRVYTSYQRAEIDYTWYVHFQIVEYYIKLPTFHASAFARFCTGKLDVVLEENDEDFTAKALEVEFYRRGVFPSLLLAALSACNEKKICLRAY